MTKFPIVVAVVALLAVVSVGLYVTDFTAYLGNDPATCNNCHVMDAAYEGWFHGTHQEWATCSDCHTPHTFIPKYFVKAKSGYHHVTAFTFGDIPVAIRAKAESREIVQENCIYCHEETVESITMIGQEFERYCWDCHRYVAHGPRGISDNPYQDSSLYPK